MRKTSYFASQDIEGWPQPRDLKRYFAPSGEGWFHTTGNDTAGFDLEGVDGTEHLPQNKGRIDIHLSIWGLPDTGVLLIYTKRGGDHRLTYSSKGDITRLKEWVRSLHEDPLPVGLFIPFPDAYEAVKEFIETDGQLPKCIEWVANKDLPPGTFPDP